ncbi:hypothetical protein DPM35_13725 [Mesorhizobium atlanticum]|uniref:Uncharacterized protein n=1 Tax=Mesorhizobium atlanticum TaxID=2233532 RepID=A0A330GZQ4_9HYPH|nr:hypothetical protein DPM35_13725 [Mesorhizobium atlanticum]
MDTTHETLKYGVAGPITIAKQKISTIILVTPAQVGELRSTPQGVDTAAPNRRYRDCAGKELPVDSGTTLGKVAHAAGV